MGRRCIIPAAALLVLSAMFSVTVSAIGGYLYYFVVFNSLRASAINDGLSAVDAVSVQISSSAVESFIQVNSLIYAASLVDYSAANTALEFTTLLNETFLADLIALSRGPLAIQGAEVAILLPRGIPSPANATEIAWVTVYYDQLDLQGSTVYTVGSVSDGITFKRFSLTFPDTYSPKIAFPARSYANDSLETLYRVSVTNESLSTLSPYVALDGSPYFFTTSYAYTFVAKGTLTLEVAVYQTVDVWFQFITDVLAGASTQIMVYEPVHEFVATTSVVAEILRQQRCYATLDEFINSDRSCLLLPYYDNPSAFIRGIIGEVVDPRWSDATLSGVPTSSSTVTVDGQAYLVITSQLVAISALRPVLIWSRSANEVLDPLRNNTIFIVMITAGAVLLSSLIVGTCTVLSLLRPMARIGEKMQQVQSMELSLSGTIVDTISREPMFAVREVDTLQQQFMALSTALVSFTKYVPFNVVRSLIRRNGVAEVGMVRDVAVVMFCDVANFSEMCAVLVDDAAVSGLLSAFFDLGSSILMRHGAIVDKFIGDCIMCFWGRPGTVEHGCFRALCGGLELLRAVGSITSQSGRPVTVRIGCHYGEVLVGNIGSSARINYTVIGDTVNTASRLESACARYYANFLASEAVLQHAMVSTESKPVFITRYVGRVSLKGKASQIRVHHIVGVAESVDDLPALRCDTSPCDGNDDRAEWNLPLPLPLVHSLANAATVRLPLRCHDWCMRYSDSIETHERTGGASNSVASLLQYLCSIDGVKDCNEQSTSSLSSVNNLFVPIEEVRVVVPIENDSSSMERALLLSMIRTLTDDSASVCMILH